jgi:hypothetical protein
MVVSVAPDLHVPDGVSGWELSVDANSHAKAEADYTKRTTSPDGSPTGDVTYVQVICRQWTKAAEFSQSKTAEGRWRHVLAYNVEDIETWLERAPATTLWFHEVRGRPVTGVTTASSWWDEWMRSTTVPLGSQVVLSGRQAQATQLKARVHEPGITTIGGDVRLEEIRAFVAAMFGGDADDSSDVRAIFLEDPQRAREMLRLPGNFVALVPGPEYLQGVSTGGSHHLLVAVPGSAQADLLIPPVATDAVQVALQDAGIQGRKASELAALARRSLLALRRYVAVRKELHTPEWSRGPDILRRRVLLLNSWNQSNSEDKEAVAQLIGQSYERIEDALGSLAGSPDDPMVSLVDERWHVVSPMDAWILVGPHLTSGDIEAFHKMGSEVLLEPDPLLEVPADKRWRASLDNISRRFSTDLREGIAKTLALMGSLDMPIGGGRSSSRSIAERMIWEILKAANSDETARTWLSIGTLLPILAEAAPSVFLTSLQEALQPGKPLTDALFTDSDDDKESFGMSTSSPHTDFLWALETVAWAPEFFDPVVSLLLRLAEIDPGGRLANRPLASLQSLFLPWHPNTSAPLDQRLATLERVRQRSKTLAWDLMISLLPSGHGFQIIHQGPAFRDWKPLEPAVTTIDYWAFVDHVSAALLEEADRDSARWVTLIGELSHLPPSARQQAVISLSHLANELDKEDDREALWQALRRLVTHHREYSDADWALPNEELNALDELIKALAPQSAARRHAWLFKEGWVTLGDHGKRDDFAAYEAALQERRVAAVREIVSEEGLDPLRSLGGEGLSGFVGDALALAVGPEFEDELFLLLASDNEADVDLAFGYFGRRFRQEGWEWMQSLLDERATGSPSVAARLLRSTRDPVEAAARAELLGTDVEREYWARFSYVGLGQDFPHVLRFSKALIRFGRSAAALDFLALYGRKTEINEDYALVIADAFESLMKSSDDPELRRLSDYDLRTLLEVLAQHREVVGADRLITIEWYFLPLLGFEPNAPNLHRALNDNPAFFAQLMSLVFRPKDVEDASEEPSEDERRAAENAYRLLSSWRTCPGSDDSGRVDGEKLRSWVEEARRLLHAAGRSAIGDQYIGHALASAPEGEDGIAPPETVRNLLEELESDQIDRGLEIQLFNQRGVTSRSLDEGGKQEWALAHDYERRAEALLEKWPRMSAIYRRLSEGYAADARREDAEAERRRRGLD